MVLTTHTLKSRYIFSIFDQCWFRARYVRDILFVEFFHIFFRIPHTILVFVRLCKKIDLKTKVFLKTISRSFTGNQNLLRFRFSGNKTGNQNMLRADPNNDIWMSPMVFLYSGMLVAMIQGGKPSIFNNHLFIPTPY